MLTSFQKFSEKESNKDTPKKINITSSREKLLESKELEPALNELLSKFLKEVMKIPTCSVLQYSTNQSELQEQLKLTMIKQIEEEVKQAPRKLEEIHDAFLKGKYDEEAFSNAPKTTKDLEAVVNQYNRDFVQRLFVKCKSIDTIKFWIETNNARLPKDSLALGVCMGCNVVVLQFLKEKGLFENLSEEDKFNLVARAKRFDGEGLKFLETEFSIESSKINPKFIK